MSLNEYKFHHNEKQSSFFHVADFQLADIETSLENISISLDTDLIGCSINTNLNAILNNIRKIKVSSILYGLDDMTEVTFILEFLVAKMIEKKLPLTQERIAHYLRIHKTLREQLDSVSLNVPADNQQMNYLQTSLNYELNQVKL